MTFLWILLLEAQICKLNLSVCLNLNFPLDSFSWNISSMCVNRFALAL